MTDLTDYERAISLMEYALKDDEQLPTSYEKLDVIEDILLALRKGTLRDFWIDTLALSRCTGGCENIPSLIVEGEPWCALCLQAKEQAR